MSKVIHRRLVDMAFVRVQDETHLSRFLQHLFQTFLLLLHRFPPGYQVVDIGHHTLHVAEELVQYLLKFIAGCGYAEWNLQEAVPSK